MSHPGRRRAADRRARRAPRRAARSERKQDRKKLARQVDLLRSGEIDRAEFELIRTDISSDRKTSTASKRAKETVSLANASARTQAKRGRPVTQQEIATRRVEQEAATRLDRGDIGKATDLERKQQKLRDDRARVRELRKEGFDEKKEAKRRGVSVNVLRQELRQLEKEVRQADAQARNITAGTALGRGAKKITFESAKTRQDIRSGTATAAQITKQQQSFEAAVNERVGQLSSKQATQQRIVRILEEESMKRALVIDTKDRERFASETAQILRTAATSSDELPPGIASELKTAATSRPGKRPGVASVLRDAASKRTQLGATEQSDPSIQAEFDARVDRAVAAIVKKSGSVDVRSEVARDMRKIAERMGLIVEPADISRFAGAVAFNAASEAPIDFSREMSISTPPVTTRFTELVDRDVKALVADPQGRDIRTEAANIIRKRADAMGLEVEPRDISAFSAAAAKAAAQNLIPDSSIEGVSAPNRRSIVQGIVSGELKAADLKDLDPTSQQRLIVIAGRPVSGATFTQMNRELSDAQKLKGQATFLDRVLTASLVDELGETGAPGQDIKLFERAKDVLGLSNVKSENTKAAKALLNDVTKTVKSTTPNDGYLIFLARTGQLDELQKTLFKQPVSDGAIQEIDGELRRQSAEETLQAMKIGALGAVGVARAPLPRAFTGLPGKTKAALKKANLPASGRALVTKVKSTTAGSTRAFKAQVNRLSKEFGESAVLGSGPVRPFKLPKLRFKQLKAGPKRESLPPPRDLVEPSGSSGSGPKVAEPARPKGSSRGPLKTQPQPSAGRPAGGRQFRKSGKPDRAAIQKSVEDFLAPPKPKVSSRGRVNKRPRAAKHDLNKADPVSRMRLIRERAVRRKAKADAGETPRLNRKTTAEQTKRRGPKARSSTQTRADSDVVIKETIAKKLSSLTSTSVRVEAAAKSRVGSGISAKEQAKPRTRARPKTQMSTQQQEKSRSEDKRKSVVGTAPKEGAAPKADPAESVAEKPAEEPSTSPEGSTTTATDPKVDVGTTTTPKPKPQPPKLPGVKTPSTAPPSRAPSGGRDSGIDRKVFSLPAEKTLPPGVFPEIVEFPMGEVIVRVDIVKGKREFRVNTGDPTVSPSDGFRVLTTTKRRPTARIFPQGVTSFVVSKQGVSFARRRAPSRRDRAFSRSRSRL